MTRFSPLLSLVLFIGCAGAPIEPPSSIDEDPESPLTNASLFECNGQLGATPARIRRLGRLEYSANVGTKNGLKAPLIDNPSDTYSTYSASETLDPSTLREYMRHTGLAGGTWSITNNNGSPRMKMLGGDNAIDGLACIQVRWNGVVDPDIDCIERFVTKVLTHGVYFRTPSQDEVSRLTTFAIEQLSRAETSPDFAELDAEQKRELVITTILRAAWLTRSALFRNELGRGQRLPDGRTQLSEREFVQSLSLAIGHHIAGVSIPGYKTLEGEDNRYFQHLHYSAFDDNGRLTTPDDQTQKAMASLDVFEPEVIHDFVDKFVAGADPGVCYPDDDPSTYSPDAVRCDAPTSSSRVPGSACYEDEYWMAARIRLFFQEWLDYQKADALFKEEPEATSLFDDGTYLKDYYPDVNDTYYFSSFADRQIALSYSNSRLVDHLDNMIARIVANDEHVLKELLTSRTFFINGNESYDHNEKEYYDKPEINSVYNYALPDSGAVHSIDERWVTLPDTERAGVLTHPAWLAAHGDAFENGPSVIHRGKWIREQLLCDTLPDVPITVDANLDPATKELSARERVAMATDEDPACASCHKWMNPLGYPFEIYNHTGFLRDDDHGRLPDGSSVLSDLPEGSDIEDGTQVSDAVELMTVLSESQTVQRCFIRQSFRFFMGRDETLQDACTLSDMEAAYEDSNGSFKEMLSALFQSDSFQLRSHEEVSP